MTLALGTHTVTLTVDDGNGESDSATTLITVVDTTPPVIQSNAPATIIPPDAPISFTASASDTCSPTRVNVVSFDCFMISGAGKRVDKTESCVVELSGDTITISDSGGVGDNILWTVSATDDDGNTTTETFTVTVENPGKGK